MGMVEKHSSPSRWWLLQLAASGAVLVWLIRSVELDQLRALPARVHVGLLLAALLIKALALLLHDVRVWVMLPSPRPPLSEVVRVGLISGVINLFSPGRAGDLVNIALLRTRVRVPLGTATASMGLVAVIEAAAFGSLLLAGLAAGLKIKK